MNEGPQQVPPGAPPPPPAGPPGQPPSGQPPQPLAYPTPTPVQPPQAPPGATPPPFMPPIVPTPKKKGLPRGAKIAIAIGSVVLVLGIIFVVLAVVLLVNVLSKPADVANDYMKALKQGKLTEAWNLLSAETQAEEGQSGFEQKMAPLSGKVEKYTASGVQISDDRAEVTMNIRLNGETGTWYIYLVKKDGEWKVRTITGNRLSGFD